MSESNDSEGCFYLVVLPIVAVFYCLTAIFTGWTNVPRATEVLAFNNLTPISVGGVAWFSCGEGDWYATKFTAKTASGKVVSGEVCEGMVFKGQTIRYDFTAN